ncbi:purple acid phosphatase family protein [Propionibacterium australiense]|uniref:Metallophosphoesterase family protein n=1 Tax=Propionibacterium australiense TaxID=119981 RepID=A0A8B3FVZ6_9ACTN|nr:metallophosphoesterase family protein [Propionibacterium australiense]RLP10969.1 metallophosphoesterase family protein [Propionibacterium australiense]RLP13064.1 metallophosphoesterase family protein [Propionibacterium australiense]
MPKRFLATDLEVLTITPTSAVISWITRRIRHGRLVPEPYPTDARVWLGAAGSHLRLVHESSRKTAFHQVTVTGLEPGREYHFRAMSGDQQPTPGMAITNRRHSPERTHHFMTLTPPPGRYLETIVLANDTHLGEKRQGIVLGPLPTSVKPGPGQKDYAQVMFTTMLDELASRRGRPFLVLGGDVTSKGTVEQAACARALLDGYGVRHESWLAVRGNHDRPQRDGTDPFAEYFTDYQTMCSATTASGLRVVGLDTTRGSGGGWITPEQMSGFRSLLAENHDHPTIVTAHHPATNDAAMTYPSGPQFMLRLRDRIELQHAERKAHGLFLHHAGHTHRMRRDRADVQGTSSEYLEVAACSSYPAGYALLHLYEGGYLVNFWRIGGDDAAAWQMRSRWQAMGLGPLFTVGSTNDRNHVVLKDLSGLRPSGMPVPPELRV